MRCRSVRSPVVHKPTKANATGDTLHSNFADESFLGSTCGFLTGTGYLDERLMPGSNVLRHKLPPVKLRHCASSPHHRDADFRLMSEMKAFEGVYGPKGVRLVGRVRESISRDKMGTAFAEGDMNVLRAAVRGAHFGSRLHKDPQVEIVNSAISKYDKCLIECREGLAERDMIRLQLAMDHMYELSEQGLGPRVMENPILISARDALSKWAPYRPYLNKLGTLLLAGPRRYVQYWLVVIEGALLNAELEAAATADLARFGQAGATALEEALAVPDIRYHYDLPWSCREKNALPLQVRSRLAVLGIDITALKMRVVVERDALGYPALDAPTSVVVTGPTEAMNAMAALTGVPNEPMVCNLPATADSPQRRAQRGAAHQQRLAAARSALEDAQDTAAVSSPGAFVENAGGTGSIRSEMKARRSSQRHELPSSGPWFGQNMFTKTL